MTDEVAIARVYVDLCAAQLNLARADCREAMDRCVEDNLLTSWAALNQAVTALRARRAALSRAGGALTEAEMRAVYQL